jgi:hypothetical protein
LARNQVFNIARTGVDYSAPHLGGMNISDSKTHLYR